MVQGDHYFPFPKRKIMTEQVHNDDDQRYNAGKQQHFIAEQ